MSPALANFLFEIANFLVLAGLLGWFFFKPVRAWLEKEQASVRQEVEAGEKLRAEAEALGEQARAERERLEKQTDAHRAELIDTARRQAADLLRQARERRAEEQRSFEADLAAERRRDAQALAEEVGRIAGKTVHALLETVQGPDLELALVRAACERLRALPEAERRGAVVESAQELGPEAKLALQEVLGEFQEQSVPGLGAGVRVRTSQSLVEATSSSLARHAAQELERVATEAEASDG